MNALAKLGASVSKNLMRCKPVAKAVAKINKNKPEILAISGGVMIVAAFGWAIYEAVGLKDILVETSDEVKKVETRHTEETSKEMPEKELQEATKRYKKELTMARVHGVWRVGKRFIGPSLTLMAGLGLSTKGFCVLRTRNVVLGTALKGTKDAFKFYRDNVREDLGKDADLKYARGVVDEKEIEETRQDESGKETTVKSKVPVTKDHDNPWRFEYSDVYFDSYQDSSDVNIMFLKCAQDWWNHQLNSYGESGISMYEILKYLGFKFEVMQDGMTRTQFKKFMSFVRNYGWRKGSNGDGFIDFGIYRSINEAALRRRSDIVWIEFNCDGPLDEI